MAILGGVFVVKRSRAASSNCHKVVDAFCFECIGSSAVEIALRSTVCVCFSCRAWEVSVGDHTGIGLERRG